MDISPTNLTQVVLLIVVGLTIAAVGWIAKTVIGLMGNVQSLNDRHAEQREDTNRRFLAIENSLQKINEKLDRLMEKINL